MHFFWNFFALPTSIYHPPYTYEAEYSLIPYVCRLRIRHPIRGQTLSCSRENSEMMRFGERGSERQAPETTNFFTKPIRQTWKRKTTPTMESLNPVEPAGLWWYSSITLAYRADGSCLHHFAEPYVFFNSRVKQRICVWYVYGVLLGEGCHTSTILFPHSIHLPVLFPRAVQLGWSIFKVRRVGLRPSFLFFSAFGVFSSSPLQRWAVSVFWQVITFPFPRTKFF